MATEAVRLREIWEDPPGLNGWLSTVDHKRLGVRYLMTSFIFLLVGGIEALMMRTQLMQPESGMLSPDEYNQVFSMHGTTMIFLFAMPMAAGFGNYLVPLMIGARDMAFPRVNAFSYWVFLLAGAFMYSSFLIGQAPNGGWYAYAPLTGPVYDPGLNMDFWTLGIIFLGISTTAGAINFIVTIFKLRAPGMSVNRMPLFIWNILVMAFMIIFAIPSLTSACTLLFFDRRFGMHFFDPNAGGNPLLWQHLFWTFGHPDVYILFLPPIGMASMIISVFSRRPIVGYTFLTMAAVAVGFISFGVWVHHMFATGLSLLEMSFFTGASLMIPIPSAIQMFSWVATIWSGNIWRKPPLLFTIGFIIIFIMGGVTGVMQAVVPFDWQVTHSYWVIAHFHYVLIGTVVFPVFAAFYYWLPKITGRMLNDRIGRWSFWLMFIGFNLTFLLLHIVGLLGAPRRIYTYQAGLGWDPFFLISTVGAYILALGILAFIWNVVQSLRNGEVASDNPWNAGTLEWATASPPAAYNFRFIPTVTGRDPLWDQPLLGQMETQPSRQEQEKIKPQDLQRVTLGTTLTDAVPQAVIGMPGPTYWPLATAFGMAVFFTAMLIASISLIVIGALFTMAAIVGWLFPPEAIAPRRPAAPERP